MTGPNDRNAGQPPADQSAYTIEDAFAPGGEPRGKDEMDETGGATDAATDAATAAAAEGATEGAAMEAGGEPGAEDVLRRELEEQRDRFLRLAAEYDNYRRRTQREQMEAATRGQAELVKKLLESLDDLDRVAHVDTATATAASVVEGVELVCRKLGKTLGNAGLEVVNPLDQPFDPAFHEALTTVPAGSVDEDDTVAQVYQLGYIFAGQLIRPARVVVRQWNG